MTTTPVAPTGTVKPQPAASWPGLATNHVEGLVR
jgi:hypothetical protein